MPDAEIIRIGTGGRPGRGSGDPRPSASGRKLAGKPAGGSSRSAAGQERTGRPGGARTTDRAPEGGIPPEELLAALTSAAREVFGEEWERRLARALAFLRRRLTGDFVVDEYGFDAEVTEKLLLAALRPIAEKWFRIEVQGADNIPAEGGARSRSTG
jgi:hypothetical protein